MRKQLKKFQNKVFIFGLVVASVDVFLQIYFRSVGFGVPNYGISFGVLQGMGVWASLVILAAFLVWVLVKVYKKETIESGLILIAMGGLGNGLGRFLLGNVWDYISLPFLPFWFNLSDLLISLGVVSYILGGNADRRPV